MTKQKEATEIRVKGLKESTGLFLRVQGTKREKDVAFVSSGSLRLSDALIESRCFVYHF